MISFILGLLAGGTVGMVATALCVAAKGCDDSGEEA
ncbi:MAG: DUF3789 domain-containing protein [Clostridiales bacterium]|nr:DUF3789 domain-containing protein [Clostridiales bacterium]